MFLLLAVYNEAKMKDKQINIEPNINLKGIFKIILLIIGILLLLIGAKYFHIQENLQQTLQWIGKIGPWGPIAFITIYIFATILFIPGSLLTLGAGVIFKLFWGAIYVFIGATLGATSAFLIGRYLARNWVEKKIQNSDRFQAIDAAVAKAGLKIVLLTRLSPIFPFNLLNYAFSITRVSLKDYFLGCIGMIPGTIMYVYIGFLAGDLAAINTAANNTSVNAPVTAQWIIRIIGFIATVAVTIYITRIAKTALETEIK